MDQRQRNGRLHAEDLATGPGRGWGHLRPESDSAPGAAPSATLPTCPWPAPLWGPPDPGQWRNHLLPCRAWPQGCQQEGGHQARPSSVGLPSPRFPPLSPWKPATYGSRPRRCHLLSDPQSPHGRKSSLGRLAPLQRGKAEMVLEQAGRWGRRPGVPCRQARGTRCMLGRLACGQRGAATQPCVVGQRVFQRDMCPAAGKTKRHVDGRWAARVGDGHRVGGGRLGRFSGHRAHHVPATRTPFISKKLSSILGRGRLGCLLSGSDVQRVCTTLCKRGQPLGAAPFQVSLHLVHTEKPRPLLP